MMTMSSYPVEAIPFLKKSDKALRTYVGKLSELSAVRKHIRKLIRLRFIDEANAQRSFKLRRTAISGIPKSVSLPAAALAKAGFLP